MGSASHIRSVTEAEKKERFSMHYFYHTKPTINNHITISKKVARSQHATAQKKKKLTRYNYTVNAC